ncbi:hypothetical protein CA85_18230 [Allorhodopirellula solitaria]|uniref:Uncharacterized protein n=1 Tax=Allorhodopirellula solitaria TaxID=2527987 RepID=A0A5C5YE90_9BACT|nr:hypothetical protein CA85_18230 [Allorhodopirellula solitaria]
MTQPNPFWLARDKLEFDNFNQRHGDGCKRYMSRSIEALADAAAFWIMLISRVVVLRSLLPFRRIARTRGGLVTVPAMGVATVRSGWGRTTACFVTAMLINAESGVRAMTFAARLCRVSAADMDPRCEIANQQCRYGEDSCRGTQSMQDSVPNGDESPRKNASNSR